MTIHYPTMSHEMSLTRNTLILLRGEGMSSFTFTCTSMTRSKCQHLFKDQEPTAWFSLHLRDGHSWQLEKISDHRIAFDCTAISLRGIELQYSNINSSSRRRSSIDGPNIYTSFGPTRIGNSFHTWLVHLCYYPTRRLRACTHYLVVVWHTLVLEIEVTPCVTAPFYSMWTPLPQHSEAAITSSLRFPANGTFLFSHKHRHGFPEKGLFILHRHHDHFPLDISLLYTPFFLSRLHTDSMVQKRKLHSTHSPHQSDTSTPHTVWANSGIYLYT